MLPLQSSTRRGATSKIALLKRSVFGLGAPLNKVCDGVFVSHACTRESKCVIVSAHVFVSGVILCCSVLYT